MSKYAQIKQRRERFGLLCNWYGPERAAVEISAHTPQPLALSDVVEAVCGDIRSPEVAHFIELETNWEKIVGQSLARLTHPVRLREKVLYLEVPHSALLRELAPSRDLFLRRIAACIGKGACESIKLIPSGSLSRSRRGK